MTVAAVDLGTTTARVGVFDAEGTRRAVVRRRLSTRHPFPGAVEQDPEEFVTVTTDLLGSALREAGIGVGDVEALAITTQRATVVAWDAETGRPLAPAIGWQDTRTAERVAAFVADGIPLTTSASCSKLEWLVGHDDVVRAAADRGVLRLGTVDTWLTGALAGGDVHVTDPSNAGATGCYDLRSGDWSDGALALFGVPRGPLAEVVDSNRVVGTTAAEVAGAEIPLAARLGDQQAAAAAHGLAPGEAKLTLGTSAMLDLVIGPEPRDAPAGSYTLPLWRRTVAGERAEEFMIESSIQTAGAVVEWLVRIGVLGSVEQLDEVASHGTPGPVFAPVLAGLGSPWQEPATRGLLAGIALETTAADIARAALDGIADRVAELATGSGLGGELRVDGGLSRSRVLLASIADASGLTVRPAADPETTLHGAAMVAASSPDLDLAPMPPVEHAPAIEPSTDEAARATRRDRWAETLATIRR